MDTEHELVLIRRTAELSLDRLRKNCDNVCMGYVNDCGDIVLTPSDVDSISDDIYRYHQMVKASRTRDPDRW